MEAAELSETSTHAIWLNGIITLKTIVFWFLAYLRIGFIDKEEYHKCWAVTEVERIVLGVLEMIIPEFYCATWEKLWNEGDYLSSRLEEEQLHSGLTVVRRRII